jgi:NAD(P)-dependent dehydrogenase (short-subunit alcohol dehydrogenase family)
VTGGSSGLGGAAAARLAGLGHRVYAASRRGTIEPGSSAMPLQMDVDDETSVSEGVGRVWAAEGRIDAVVNAAGFAVAGAVEDTPMALAEAQFNTNVFGVLRVCRRVLPLMRRAGGGLIINVTSIAGQLSLPFQGLYSASKWAVEGLTEALRVEVRPYGVRVVLVEPGDFRTGLTAARHAAVPDDSAYATTARRAIGIAAADERAGADPGDVARLIGRILVTRRPKLRYVVGPADEVWLMRLRHVLPARWLIARHFGA